MDGQGIGITATQGATYNTIHTASSGSTATIDEVYLYAQNNFSEALNLVLEWGTSATASTMVIEVAAKSGPQLVIPGLLILGSSTAAIDIVAFVGNTASLATSGVTQLSVHGYVNRIVQS